MNQHRLVIDRKVIEWDYNSTKSLPPEHAFKYQLFYQMSRITRDRGSLAHDDRLDCLSMAVAYWTETMAQDAEKRMQDRREALIEQELKDWERGTKAGISRLSILLGKGCQQGGKDSGESGATTTTSMKFSFRTYSAGKEREERGRGRGKGTRLGGLL